MIWLIFYLKPYKPDRDRRTRRASLAGQAQIYTLVSSERHKNTCWEMLSSLLHPLHISASLSSAALIPSRDKLSDVLLSHLKLYFHSVMLKLDASDIMMSMNTNIRYV